MKIAYDGTNYCGFQIQDTEITVEQVLNEKLSNLLKEEIKVIGASRTDSGVHALGNVVVFDTEARMDAGKMATALNTHLPQEIRAIYSKEVSLDFHPRHCETVKTYEYKIYNAKVNNPLLSRYTQFEYLPLDIDRMRQAAAYIPGEHDFKAFCSSKTSAQSTIRNVYTVEVIVEGEKSGALDEGGIDRKECGVLDGEESAKKENTELDGGESAKKESTALDAAKQDKKEFVPSLITIRVKGNGFLYNMVRIIAGTLIAVGKGRLEPECVKKALESLNRDDAGPTAPAKGLTLVEIKYDM